VATPVTAAPKPEVLRDRTYLGWLRYQRCVICEGLDQTQQTSSDAAHTPRTRIHGDVALPLCRMHHDEEERLQPAAFAAQYALILLRAAAVATYRQFQAEQQAVAF
jgi:hypothetical protein